MSGWQVADKVKGINGGVPVVLITGWDIKQEESKNVDIHFSQVNYLNALNLCDFCLIIKTGKIAVKML